MDERERVKEQAGGGLGTNKAYRNSEGLRCLHRIEPVKVTLVRIVSFIGVRPSLLGD